jgi:hypothetical protein
MLTPLDTLHVRRALLIMKIGSRSTSTIWAAASLLLLSQLACGRGSNSSDDLEDDDVVGGSGSVAGSSNPGGGNVSHPGGGNAATAGSGGASASAGSEPNPTAGSANGGSGGSGGVVKPLWPDGRGPSVAFTTYEAEAMDTNGVKTVPTRAFGRASTEASGRQAVTLSTVGQQVVFENKEPSNSIVVRYSIPDGGHDYWTTLSVFVDGVPRGKLSLTSRYSWTYGAEDAFNKPNQEDKGAGNDHHFYDEAHALIGDIPVGAKVALRKEAGDSAAYYTIDLVEMELVGGAIAKPANAVSITDCGAKADDNQDDSVAIQECIDEAQAFGKPLYIPEGTFQSYSKPLSGQALTIQGAGMWRSAIVGFNAQIDCWGAGGCKFSDFGLFGDTVARDDASPETGFRGNLSNSVIKNVWIEHLKVGIWPSKSTGNLLVSGVRARNLMADGVNLYNGTHDSIVENSHFRNTGDDAIAIWSHGFESPGPSRANVIRKNYVQVPWKANCFGVYGGADNEIEDNVCADTVQYPGMFFAAQFDSMPFTGTTEVSRNTLLRCGGNAYNHTHGAIKFHADQGPVGNIKVTDLDIIAPTNSAVHVQGGNVIDKVWLNDVTIQDPGQASFFLNEGSKGALDAVKVTATGGNPGVVNDSGGAFNLIKGAGSTGW